MAIIFFIVTVLLSLLFLKIGKLFTKIMAIIFELERTVQDLRGKIEIYIFKTSNVHKYTWTTKMDFGGGK